MVAPQGAWFKAVQAELILYWSLLPTSWEVGEEPFVTREGFYLYIVDLSSRIWHSIPFPFMLWDRIVVMHVWEPDSIITIFCYNFLFFFFPSIQMSALKSANQELKGMMKTVKIQDIDVCITFIFFPYLASIMTFVNFLVLSWWLLWSLELARWDDGPYGCEYWNSRDPG